MGGGTVTYQVTVIFHNVISIFKLVKFEASHNMKDISRIIEGQYLLPCIILSAAWDRWTLSDIWHGSCWCHLVEEMGIEQGWLHCAWVARAQKTLYRINTYPATWWELSSIGCPQFKLVTWISDGLIYLI